jgi:GT2 family glycosyltransferase
MIVSLAGSDHPEVSVVMVTHGAWDLTERALSTLAMQTDRQFEVIIVDNDSDDDTRAQLSKLRNFDVVLNDRNRGFGPANNQGAERARGDYLLLLNTDAFVHPGWLKPLLEALRDPSTGAAVPRYLNPDGTLQEAGALLARDGTVMPYGEGDDPDLPCYQFARRVDYGSAACMLLRRSAFEGVGGFDERFAPAYFEDVDLCLRLAKAGQAVVYEPRSTVTHLRHGSGEPADARRLSERNHRLFFELRGGELEGRPWTLVNASEQAVIAARDALATPRVLACLEPGDGTSELIVATLLDGWPAARITWVADSDATPRAETASWVARGVEVFWDGDFSRLHRRLFHYDIVLRRAGTNSGPPGVVGDTQPQARTIAIAESYGIAAKLVGALAAAGIAPQRELVDSG